MTNAARSTDCAGCTGCRCGNVERLHRQIAALRKLVVSVLEGGGPWAEAEMLRQVGAFGIAWLDAGDAKDWTACKDSFLALRGALEAIREGKYGPPKGQLGLDLARTDDGDDHSEAA